MQGVGLLKVYTWRSQELINKHIENDLPDAGLTTIRHVTLHLHYSLLADSVK